MLGERWKAMSADDKKQYEQMAAKDKVRYAEAMKVYKEKSGGAPAGRGHHDGDDIGGDDDE